MTSQSGYLRAGDVAKHLGIAKSTVWLYAKQGLIRRIKTSPRVTLFALADIENFVASRMGA